MIQGKVGENVATRDHGRPTSLVEIARGCPRLPGGDVPSVAYELCSLRIEIVKMKSGVLEAIWRCQAYMTGLMSALLVSVLGILVVLAVRL